MNLYLIECEIFGMATKAVVACHKVQNVAKFIGWDKSGAEDVEVTFIGVAHGYEDNTIICIESP